MRDALRRHRWAIATIFVASWGWALAWPQGVVTTISSDDPAGLRDRVYEEQGWGLHGAFRSGRNSDPLDPLGPEGWSVDLEELGLGCWVATLLSVFSSAWWVAFRRPPSPHMTPAATAARLLKLAIWPTVLGHTLGLWLWQELGRVAPPSGALLRPEWMLLGTLFVVSVGAVWLATPRSTRAD